MNLEEANKYLFTFKDYFHGESIIKLEEDAGKPPRLVIGCIGLEKWGELKFGRKDEKEFLKWIGDFIIKKTTILKPNTLYILEYKKSEQIETKINIMK